MDIWTTRKRWEVVQQEQLYPGEILFHLEKKNISKIENEPKKKFFESKKQRKSYSFLSSKWQILKKKTFAIVRIFFLVRKPEIKNDEEDFSRVGSEVKSQWHWTSLGSDKTEIKKKKEKEETESLKDFFFIFVDGRWWTNEKKAFSTFRKKEKKSF